MTRIAYLDPVGGISGDMLLAALLDAGGDRSVVDDTVESLQLNGVELAVERTPLGDLAATQVTLRVTDRAEARSATSMLSIVAEASLPERSRSLAIETLHRLARAEARLEPMFRSVASRLSGGRDVDYGGAIRPYLLRITHIYRREGDDWKVVHEHSNWEGGEA